MVLALDFAEALYAEADYARLLEPATFTFKTTFSDSFESP